MSMSKKDFIALADTLRIAREQVTANYDFPENIKIADQTWNEITLLIADFCKSQNGNFIRERWLGYIAGANGKNGGTVKK